MTDTPQATGPLRGIRVLELIHMIMGPSCAMALGDLGADVIKIEPGPDGDTTRRLRGAAIGFFPSFNCNERSPCLDLKSPESLATQSLRVMDRTGDPPRIAALFRRLPKSVLMACCEAQGLSIASIARPCAAHRGGGANTTRPSPAKPGCRRTTSQPC